LGLGELCRAGIGLFVMGVLVEIRDCDVRDDDWKPCHNAWQQDDTTTTKEDECNNISFVLW
jgi:hypothetical protein